jgi:hypothetical protein
MRWRTLIATVSTASSVFVVADIPVFAQSDSHVARESSAPAVITRHTPAPVMRVYGSDEPPTASSVELPVNLTFAEHFRPTIEAMLERSPTFRRQCLRIAQTPGLMVRMRLLHGNPTSGVRARTDIGISADRRVIASVAIRPLENLPELIAHEFEHILEQLDGRNLPQLANNRAKDVWYSGSDVIETDRAIRAGRTVRDELRQAQSTR